MMTLLYILMAASFASELFRIIDRIEGRRQLHTPRPPAHRISEAGGLLLFSEPPVLRIRQILQERVHLFCAAGPLDSLPESAQLDSPPALRTACCSVRALQLCPAHTSSWKDAQPIWPAVLTDLDAQPAQLLDAVDQPLLDIAFQDHRLNICPFFRYCRSETDRKLGFTPNRTSQSIGALGVQRLWKLWKPKNRVFVNFL